MKAKKFFDKDVYYRDCARSNCSLYPDGTLIARNLRWL